jgi:hypothetical protein
MSKYKKKPVVVEAIEWTGTNLGSVWLFMGEPPTGITVVPDQKDLLLKMPTLEDIMTARPGDFIIRGIKGEFYPCKPEIFRESYDMVNDDE